MEKKDLEKLLAHRSCYIKKLDGKFKSSKTNKDQKEQLLEECEDYNKLITAIDDILIKNGRNPKNPESLGTFRKSLNKDISKFTSIGNRILDI